MPDTASRSYQLVARTYDGLAHIYSFGRIRAVKASQVPELTTGDRILYAGVGSGEDAVLAAQRGAAVTCLDLAPGMLERARHRFRRAGVDGEFVSGDVMQHRPEAAYDAVAANFFLNIFPEPVMEQVLGKLVELTRPGGKVMIADYAPPDDGAFGRAFQRAYARSGNLSFWAIGLAPLHPIYDYRRYLARAGLDLLATKDFRLVPLGPPVYRSLVTGRK
jgi:demethylmenaquinone methyltransferase/2-methoxy-6-polyprenyl-1,4-benzoquinol methylase